MTESVSLSRSNNRKKTSIQERSVLVDDFIVVNGYEVNSDLLKRRFPEGGYQAQETSHFILFTRQEEPKTILVHLFSPDELHADIKHYIIQELKPLEVLKQSSDFGNIISGTVGSLFPNDARLA